MSIYAPSQRQSLKFFWLKWSFERLVIGGDNSRTLFFGWHFATYWITQEVNMAQSVKLADDIMALVRREADLHSRSVAGQITHWLKIGRAIERSGNFDHTRITAALEGRLDTVELREEEESSWLDAFATRMAEPMATEQEFFAQRRRLGLGVGLDAGGNLIYAEDAAGE
ncbi:ParD-like family protein [Roseibium aggregatum]|nr:ParD-like family protein [Roseibium aggregatum]